MQPSSEFKFVLDSLRLHGVLAGWMRMEKGVSQAPFLSKTARESIWRLVGLPQFLSTEPVGLGK